MYKIDKKLERGERDFPFDKLKIGESFVAQISAEKIRQSARSFARFKKGFEVSVRTLPDYAGSECTRIA